MKNLKNQMAKLIQTVLLTLFSLALTNCSEEQITTEGDKIKQEIQLELSSIDVSEMASVLSDLDIHSVITGESIAESFYNVTLGAANSFTINIDQRLGCKLYLLSDPSDVIDSDASSSMTAAILLDMQTKSDLIGGIQPFFTGVNNISPTSKSATNIEMLRGVARLNITVDLNVTSIAVNSLTLEKINLVSYVFPRNPVEYPIQETGSFSKTFNPALTSATENVCYLVEQSHSDSMLKINVEIDGKVENIEAVLPNPIERNKTYTVNITRIGADFSATITVGDWENGETITPKPVN